jgi:hypothetical protein
VKSSLEGFLLQLKPKLVQIRSASASLLSVRTGLERPSQNRFVGRIYASLTISHAHRGHGRGRDRNRERLVPACLDALKSRYRPRVSFERETVSPDPSNVRDYERSDGSGDPSSQALLLKEENDQSWCRKVRAELRTHLFPGFSRPNGMLAGLPIPLGLPHFNGCDFVVEIPQVRGITGVSSVGTIEIPMLVYGYAGSTEDPNG